MPLPLRAAAGLLPPADKIQTTERVRLALQLPIFHCARRYRTSGVARQVQITGVVSAVELLRERHQGTPMFPVRGAPHGNFQVFLRDDPRDARASDGRSCVRTAISAPTPSSTGDGIRKQELRQHSGQLLKTRFGLLKGVIFFRKAKANPARSVPGICEEARPGHRGNAHCFNQMSRKRHIVVFA